MQIDPGFVEKVEYLDLDTMETSPDTLYIVDGDLRLRAHNTAWTTFARDNNGQAVLARYRWGDPIDAAFPDDLKKYYLTVYRKALADHVPFEHDYECSSAAQFRRLRQTAYPLVGDHGLVIANHLVEVYDHRQQAHAFEAKYLDTHGNLTQCCHCRKLRDPSDHRRWIWVPSIVDAPMANTSHSMCPRCLDFYYPDIDGR